MTYDFHYTPTGTGVISGKEVLEQTEDAINDLGTQISGDVQTAIDTANNALNTANTASADAQNAVNTAYTAYTAATNAQNTANAAQTTATNAQNAATAAQNDVDALENVVTGIEGRLTTTEGNVTNLTTRMGTAEGNIGNLQTAVSTAQATANSAQQTATTARQQSYVFRYSSTALTPSSTNSNTLLDNTDNLKVGDKVIDSSGVLFSITAIDTANSTFTIGTALLDLAQDSDVVHKSGNETISGIKSFSDNIRTKKIISNVAQLQINARSNADSVAIIGGDSASEGGGIWIYGKNSANNSHVSIQVYDTVNSTFHAVRLNMDGSLTPTVSNNGLGSSSYKWVSFNGLNPSSLGMPDLANGIDISSYFDISIYTGQTYTPPANGWISFSITSPNRGSILCEATGISQTAYGVTDPDDNNKYRVSILIPCQESQTLTTYIRASGGTVNFAKFYPCQGNV